MKITPQTSIGTRVRIQTEPSGWFAGAHDATGHIIAISTIGATVEFDAPVNFGLDAVSEATFAHGELVSL